MSSHESPHRERGTRYRILEAAWKLIEERGTRVRLVDVANKAGVSRQAVYLHFGDRTGLLVALVEHVDETLGLEELVTHALDAPAGAEVLERMVELHSIFTPKIDGLTRVLEAAHYDDEALAAAWKNRMNGRRAIYRTITQRIADEGQLAEGWTVDTAADLCYTVTMPGPWRELTRELGWTPELYAEHVARLLRRGILADPRRLPTGNSGKT